MINLQIENVFTFENMFLLVTIIGLFAVMCVFFYLNYTKKHLKAHILQQRGETYYKVKTKSLPYTTEFFTFKNKEYHVNPQATSYFDNVKSQLFYDITKTEPLKIDWDTRQVQIIDSSAIKKLVKDKVIEQIAKGATSSLSLSVMLMVVFTIMGLAIGIIIGLYIPEPTSQIVTNATRFITP